MIDTHCHVLWQVDDASQSEETSLRMLHNAKQDGVTKILCTPHCLPRYKYENDLDTLKQPFDRLKSLIAQQQLDLEVYLGCEFFGTDQSLHWLEEKRAVTLNGSNRILLEFPWYQQVTNQLSETELIEKILKMGYRIIIAHPERYPIVQNQFDILNVWRKMGCSFQVNRTSLLDMDQNAQCSTAINMFKAGLIDVIASDAHSDHGNRIIALADVRRKVVKQYNQEVADLWLNTNPQALIDGTELNPI